MLEMTLAAAMAEAVQGKTPQPLGKAVAVTAAAAAAAPPAPRAVAARESPAVPAAAAATPPPVQRTLHQSHQPPEDGEDKHFKIVSNLVMAS